MSETTQLEAFEVHRPALLSLAYRMLGDMGRAEEIVQDAWLRWDRHEGRVDSARAFLLHMTTNLCLNELGSARARREQRADFLPEPVALESTELSRVESLDQISMAFLVLLQRLTPAERAVLLLHDVFDMAHGEIAASLQRSEDACRQLLRRARTHVQRGKRALKPDPDQHLRMLQAFARAASSGDIDALTQLLAEDVVLIADTGPAGGTFGGARNLGAPLLGAAKVAAFAAAVTPRGAAGLHPEACELNGEPALLLRRPDGSAQSALLVVVEQGRIAAVYIHADPDRLGRLH